VAALVAGLALVTAVVAWVGLHGVVTGVAAVGLGGFSLFTLYWPTVLLVLGLAWFAVAPGARVACAWAFVWGRMVREAASDLLPLAQLGGLVAGARAAQTAGVAEDVVLAATIIDITTELAAQVLYTLTGVALLAVQLRGGVWPSGLWTLCAAAVGLLALAILGFLAVQRRGVRWVGWVARRWLPDSVTRAEAVQTALQSAYGQPVRIAAGVALHGLGWLGSGAGSWIALRLMGADTPLWAVFSIESLMYAARSIGFVLPGGLGVQEGAYVLLAPLFGLAPAELLALSLLKRARDLVIGAPTLLAWQASEGRALWRSAPRPAPAPDA
jgi:putative membrane protein